MSKELADSIVLAAQKMERNEVEMISLIICFNKALTTHCQTDGGPKSRAFASFAEAYNYLAMSGYQEVSQERETRIKKSLEVALEDGGGMYRFILVMSKKVNKE